MDEMKYLAELAVRDYYFSTQRTSTIALAAIFNVIRGAATIESQEQELLGSYASSWNASTLITLCN